MGTTGHKWELLHIDGNYKDGYYGTTEKKEIYLTWRGTTRQRRELLDKDGIYGTRRGRELLDKDGNY